MPDFARTPRATVRRKAQRASYARTDVNAILDEAPFCSVGFVEDGRPVVIPINHWRIGDSLYFHGSPASRLLGVLCAGAEVCVTATLVDGWVLARSAARHSTNYRSAVVFGRAREVTDRAAKMAAFAALIERLAPGRWAEVRPPSDSELDSVRMAALPLEEASVKMRAGPPADTEEDHALPVWAGVVPMRLVAGPPVPDDGLDPAIPLPECLKPRNEA
ncbi:MAG: pyridoxamine 5'-phosphate oxidase family protein [Rhodospirillales bacterium]|nr:pyridoxamine 5'-phosphate oxidase family protein [Rhodospirillales bacterium]